MHSTQAMDEDVACPQCGQPCKTAKGLQIHLTKSHRQRSDSQCFGHHPRQRARLGLSSDEDEERLGSDNSDADVQHVDDEDDEACSCDDEDDDGHVAVLRKARKTAINKLVGRTWHEYAAWCLDDAQDRFLMHMECMYDADQGGDAWPNESTRLVMQSVHRSMNKGPLGMMDDMLEMAHKVHKDSGMEIKLHEVVSVA